MGGCKKLGFFLKMENNRSNDFERKEMGWA